MANAKRPRKITLLKEYNDLDRMSKSLLAHQREVSAIGRSIARKTSTDFGSGLAENLDIVLEHVVKARKELGKALTKLGRI
jgi:hypothetical protein